MRKRKTKIKNQGEFEERLINAIAYGTADEVREILKEDFLQPFLGD